MASGNSPNTHFEAMRQCHKSALPYYNGLFFLCLIGGAAALGIAFFVDMPWQIIIGLPALIAIAMSVFPWLSMRDRAERIDGLSILEDEWHDIEAAGEKRADARDGMASLLWSIYDSKTRG